MGVSLCVSVCVAVCVAVWQCGSVCVSIKRINVNGHSNGNNKQQTTTTPGYSQQGHRHANGPCHSRSLEIQLGSGHLKCPWPIPARVIKAGICSMKVLGFTLEEKNI